MKVSIKLHGVNISKVEDDDIIKDPVTKITKSNNVEKGVIGKDGFKVSIKRNVPIQQNNKNKSQNSNKRSANNNNSMRKNNRGTVTKYDKKNESSSFVKGNKDLNYSSYDAENKLLFLKSADGTSNSFNINNIPEDVLSVISGKDAVEYELEKCKHDLLTIEDQKEKSDHTIKNYKIEVEDLKTIAKKVTSSNDELMIENANYKSVIDDLNQKISELENKLTENENREDGTDKADTISLYKNLSNKYNDLVEENIRLKNNIRTLTENLDKAEASAMGLQETLQMYSEEITELKGKILEDNGVIKSESIEDKVNPEVLINEEVEGFNFIEGELTTLGKMGKYLAIDVPEYLKDDKIIVFKNFDDYITDESGNVIVVNSINGFKLNKINLTTSVVSEK